MHPSRLPDAGSRRSPVEPRPAVAARVWVRAGGGAAWLPAGARPTPTNSSVRPSSLIPASTPSASACRSEMSSPRPLAAILARKRDPSTAAWPGPVVAPTRYWPWIRSSISGENASSADRPSARLRLARPRLQPLGRERLGKRQGCRVAQRERGRILGSGRGRARPPGRRRGLRRADRAVRSSAPSRGVARARLRRGRHWMAHCGVRDRALEHSRGVIAVAGDRDARVTLACSRRRRPDRARATVATRAPEGPVDGLRAAPGPARSPRWSPVAGRCSRRACPRGAPRRRARVEAASPAPTGRL